MSGKWDIAEGEEDAFVEMHRKTVAAADRQGLNMISSKRLLQVIDRRSDELAQLKRELAEARAVIARCKSLPAKWLECAAGYRKPYAASAKNSQIASTIEEGADELERALNGGE